MRTMLCALVSLVLLSGIALAGDDAWNQLTPEEVEEGYELLFNGENMDGWQGSVDGYEAIDDILACKQGGNLYAADEYDNFVLRFSVRIPENANNGVGIRTPMNTDAAYHGMEIQILDNKGDRYENLQPYQYHGSVYGVAPAKRGFLKPAGEWNTEEIRADGSKITITLNGTVITEVDLADIEETIDHKNHPGLHNAKGHIGFLGHGARVEWHSIRILELPACDEEEEE
jgi:hypothetical protein